MSTIDTPGTTFTPEDLLRMPDGEDYELVDGKLVERNMGLESSEIAGRIFFLIMLFLRTNRIGRLFPPDATYQCFSAAPNQVRKPDVSFIRLERLPGNRLPEGHCPITPDLVVEVVSPNDLFYEVEEKVEQYLAAGVPLVWVVHPRNRTVQVRRQRTAPQGPVSQLSEGDTISGENVLPGFTCEIREFFLP
jgi:Uma2 family endonuclease